MWDATVSQVAAARSRFDLNYELLVQPRAKPSKLLALAQTVLGEVAGLGADATRLEEIRQKYTADFQAGIQGIRRRQLNFEDAGNDLHHDVTLGSPANRLELFIEFQSQL